MYLSRFLWVWMYWRDVPRETIPLRVWLTPLNYEISLHSTTRRLVTLNREGQWVRNRIRRAKQALKRAFALAFEFTGLRGFMRKVRWNDGLGHHCLIGGGTKL